MKLAIVGTGTFGGRFARAFARRGHQPAFVSRDLARARAATREAGGREEHAAARLDDALGWADAVYVATPPAFHAEAVLAATRAGRAVLLEKPVTVDLASGRALADALGPAARLVTVDENYRFLAALPAIEEQLARVGSLARIQVVVHRKRAPTGWRIDRALAGGGALADVGVHYVHLLRRLVGELDVASARMGPPLPGGTVEGVASLEARTREGGVPVAMEFSWQAPRHRSRVELIGTRGTVRFRVGKPWVFRLRFGLPVGVRRVASADPMGHEAIVDDWLAAIPQGRPGAVDLEEGLRDLAVVDRAYRLGGATPSGSSQ